MPCWYFDKKDLRNTPSTLDNIDYETELRYRKEGARFIIDTGTKMDLGYNTMATGVVYFHRFYMFHSFKNFPRYVTACCCLFLAGKTEETPKKCKDIIKTAKSLLTEQKFATFGDDPKEEVMTLERILLQTIKFDLQVEHPYHYLLKYAKCLKGDKAKLQKMVQMAWTFVNDSLCTTLCLQWEPEIIAVALMYLAGKLSKFEVVDWTGRIPKHLRWWDMFIEDVTMDLLEDICHQVLDLYSQAGTGVAPDSPPPAPPGPGSLGPPGLPVPGLALPGLAVPTPGSRPIPGLETSFNDRSPNNIIAPPPAVTPVKHAGKPHPGGGELGKLGGMSSRSNGEPIGVIPVKTAGGQHPVDLKQPPLDYPGSAYPPAYHTPHPGGGGGGPPPNTSLYPPAYPPPPTGGPPPSSSVPGGAPPQQYFIRPPYYPPPN